jgi:hypothetical protein
MASFIVHSPPSIVPGDRVQVSDVAAEPDVTWGRGGIDDWGWNADAEARDEAVDRDGGRA